MTLPNYLGISRIVLAPAAGWLGLQDGYTVPLLVVIVLAVLTDILDGVVARARANNSPFGLVLDETADKVFFTFVLVPLGHRGIVPIWMVLGILAGWLLVGGLRVYVALRGGTARPNLASKLATILIVTGIVLSLFGARLATPFMAFGLLSGVIAGVWYYKNTPVIAALLAEGLRGEDYQRAEQGVQRRR